MPLFECGSSTPEGIPPLSQHMSNTYSRVTLLYSLDSIAPNKDTAHSRAVDLPILLTPEAKGIG